MSTTSSRRIAGKSSAIQRGLISSDVAVQISLRLENVALDRHCLAMLAQMKRRIHDVMMPAPRASHNRRVAGPGDAREIHDRAREHRPAFNEAGKIRNRSAI